uniref:Uncharacterized protein n=1 Tax=Medicago truncatula TaxID=3880 RepID=B7FJD1_MEDTR|nr:unknown [Medicago truncatula]AFK43532.1 unknown [Medicago truncatula]
MKTQGASSLLQKKGEEQKRRLHKICGLAAAVDGLRSIMLGCKRSRCWKRWYLQGWQWHNRCSSMSWPRRRNCSRRLIRLSCVSEHLKYSR